MIVTETAIATSQTARQTLLNVERHLAPAPRVHYIDHTFQLPAAASKVGVRFSFHKEVLAQLFISLHDPNGFRGNRMNPGARGDIVLELWVSPDDASPGALPGTLPVGEWRVQIDVERLGEELDYRLEVYVELGNVAAPVDLNYPDDHVVKSEAGWYKGELHAHSTESDGRYPVSTVIDAGINTGLDFFALTDHFTVSQWHKLAELVNDNMVLLRSCEITSHHGHANLHGIRHWVDVYVDRAGWRMEQAAEAAHEQGGLFCVNHPYSGDLGWRAYDFDWDKADLMEIYHNLEGSNNHLQLPLWDRLLHQGHRIVGVGGTDSHDPFEGTHKLGQLVTWVYADELSERGIVDGLQRGRVYVSRGPELRFWATNRSGTLAEMWESLPLNGDEVTFHAQVKAVEPLRLFVVKDGLHFTTLDVEPSADAWQSLSFTDVPTQPAFYRLELHSIYHHETYKGIQWRDFSTVRALTNPIWIR